MAGFPRLRYKEGNVVTQLTIDRAHLALPHLVHCAQQHRAITYGELSKRMGLSHHRPLSNPLYFIRDEICTPRGLPLLTAIVVRQDTHLPGDSWLPEGTGHLSDDEYEREFRRNRDLVFVCDRWGALLEDLGLNPIQESEDK
jgi:hypothetical protein